VSGVTSGSIATVRRCARGDPGADQIRTRQAFGRHVWPYLFRDCAVTELVDSTPDDIGITADLLGHADLRTTPRHYIKAKGMTAHMRVQDMIAARRQPGGT
jgi:integrase